MPSSAKRSTWAHSKAASRSLRASSTSSNRRSDFHQPRTASAILVPPQSPQISNPQSRRLPPPRDTNAARTTRTAAAAPRSSSRIRTIFSRRTATTSRTRLSDDCSPNRSRATSTGWRCWAAAAARAFRRRLAARARTVQWAVREVVVAAEGGVGGAVPFADCQYRRLRRRPSPARGSRLARRPRGAGGFGFTLPPTAPEHSTVNNSRARQVREKPSIWPPPPPPTQSTPRFPSNSLQKLNDLI